MDVTDCVRAALAEIAKEAELPDEQVEYAVQTLVYHPNSWIFNLFDTDQIGFIYPETVMHILDVFGIQLSETRVIDIIRLISGEEDTPIDEVFFDQILAFCADICANFGVYW